MCQCNREAKGLKEILCKQFDEKKMWLEFKIAMIITKLDVPYKTEIRSLHDPDI